MYAKPPKKLLIMNILDILRKYTDENHRLSQNDILEILERDYQMKTELTDENTCVVQFTTEQGKVMTTYTFFNAVISEEKKK